MPRRVFIPNDNDYDYSAAELFGELIMLTVGPVNRMDVPRLMSTFRKGMIDAAPDDLIMASGHQFLVGIAAGLQAHRYHKIHFLQYSRKGYYESIVHLDLV